ncbi:response regulator [Vibrio sp. JPW-9-11-11]|uniref:response regulator n=1 Tax=Vibrio sp. JPW-9-11-11 TaxID=1416532 RepID=UPI001592F6AC|nr:response regulator [Vibrio sp. JPW-9-11-11]NVD09018.1 response regulator [Vibrio sp. JPW-9-11-11]
MTISKTSVYIFYNTKEILDMVEPVVSILFDSVYSIDIEREQARFIETLKEDHVSIISIYAFDSPSEAEKLARLLHGHQALQHRSRVPKQDILMCNKTFRHQAYDLCVEDVFYSYETFKPIYDTNKVVLTLRRLAQHLMTQVHLQEAEKDNSEMEASISNSLESIHCLQSEVADSSQSHTQEFDQVTEQLNSLLAHIPKGEWEKAFTNILRSMPDSVQKDALSRFSLQDFRDDIERYKNNSVAMLNRVSESLESAKPKLVTKGPLIVVADDQPVMLKIITSILEPRGYKVEVASNGVEAIMKAKVMRPSLLLLDIDMPIMDGLATLEAVKKVESLNGIPAIMLTSHSDKDIIQSSISLGAVDYVVKPTKAEILLAKIAKVIKS